MKSKRIAISIFFTSFLLVATSSGHTQTACTASYGKGPNMFSLATGSPGELGLLKALGEAFAKKHNTTLCWVKAGTGESMQLLKDKKVDMIMVHAPAAEKKAVEDGWAIKRELIGSNEFYIVGPPNDPAGIKKAKTAAEAYTLIANSQSKFFSRGDNSGTHSKEKGLWKSAGITAEGQAWYQQTGLGMGQTLNVASEKGFYTLADRGTYLAMKKTLALEILVEGEKSLLNVYHVIEVSQAKWPKVNAAGAKAFADFMVAAETQKTISGFGVEKYGAPLFFPDAGKPE